MAEWLSRDEARRLADRVLARSKAEGCQVSINSGAGGNTRYAVQGISTAGDASNATVTVASRFGKRVASVTTNVFDDDGLRRAVETSERLARLAPENPELMPLLAAQRYAEIPAFSEATAGLDAARRAEAVSGALAVVDRAGSGLVAAGFVERIVGANAVANSQGLFAYHASTAAVHIASPSRRYAYPLYAPAIAISESRAGTSVVVHPRRRRRALSACARAMCSVWYTPGSASPQVKTA